MKRAQKKYSFQTILRPEPEGGYTVIIPSLPGCITYGKTVEQAHKMAEDAITGYLVSARRAGKHIPGLDSGNIISMTTVAA
ncbi:type II toxin-antitoxin system HicB family antitoxin [Candidatus Kaiserbacteria bacterium]|nr:type II toxin-antitoxin system HicB family antitoxin [Candidatus Kaiserbacteria bacterium]